MRFYFDVDAGGGTITDAVGMDLREFDMVRTEAFDLLRAIVHDTMPEGRHTLTVHVRDATGAVSYRGEMVVVGKRHPP